MMNVDSVHRGSLDALEVHGQLSCLDWAQIVRELDGSGYAVIGPLITPQQCASLAALYTIEEAFRSRVVMARHGYGRGEYQYFTYPLPPLVARLRTTFYPPLAEIANRWNQTMKVNVQYPLDHATFLERCHGAGQVKPTPLLLKYETGDFNCLHQDLYREHVFPFQVAILLA